MKYLCYCIFIFGFSAVLQAQDTPPSQRALITDRPDATEAPSVVPAGFLQVETGGFYESFNENNVTFERNVFNTTLLRYGILSNLELRVGWNIEEQ